MKKIFLALIMISTFAFSACVTVGSNTSENPSSCVFYNGIYYTNPSLSFSNSATYLSYNGKTNGLVLYAGGSSFVHYSNVVPQEYGTYATIHQYSYNTTSATPPLPTCTSTQHLENNICVENPPVCNFGYHNDTTPAKTCVPDKECPPAMKYFAQATGTFSFDIKTCLPNRDLTPADCASKGGVYARNENSTPGATNNVSALLTHKIVMAYGKGCYDPAWIKETAIDNAINNALSFGVAKIDKAFLAQLGKSIYGAGKSLYNFVDDFFMASQDLVNAEAGLTKLQPTIIDVQIQPDGTYAKMDWQVRNEIWEDLGGGNVAPKIYPIDTPDIVPNNVYLGGDIYKIQSNLIGTKSYLDSPQIIPVPENLPINGVTNSTINLKNSLYGTETSPFNVSSTVLERSTPATGETLTKTVSKINYADGSYTEITSLERKLADATKTYEVTTKAPIETTNGIKVFENKTTYTTNNAGAVTNVVNSPSTVTYVNSSGAVTTSTNSSVSNSNTISSTQSPINLSQLQAGLDKINKQLSDLDKAMSDSVKPRDEPKSVTELKSAIENFKTGMSEYSGVLDNAVSFAGGMKDKMLGLEQQLNDALAVFDDKPQITVQSGSCPFTSHWYGKSVTVDPCMFVAPYRPILSAFLTFFMSFGVLMFCLKFFFRIGS